MIDFTNYEKDLLKTYGGANGNKICIVYAGDKYMLKFPPTAKKTNEVNYEQYS